MLRNYVKIALRILQRSKGYSFINIAGLSLGMACFVLITMWIMNEIGYDDFHQNLHRLYRINTRWGEPIEPNSSFRLGRELKARYPEIESCTHVVKWGRSLMKYNGKSYDEKWIYLVDPEFFTMFSFPFKAGNPATALQDRYSLVLTEKTAKKYFGDDNAIGKRIYSVAYEKDFVVRGVIENIPENSTFQFNIAANVDLMPRQDKESWACLGQTYAMLHENVLMNEANQTIKGFYQENVNPETSAYPELQEFSSLHLYERGVPGIIKQVYIFTIIAIFILVIAFINFMNLSTARAAKRAQEVGIRKVNGAYRFQLIVQFIGESIIMSITALVLSIIVLTLVLPYFNQITGKNITLFSGDMVKTIGGLILLALISGVISGSYPAFYLSAFNPIKVIKGRVRVGKSGPIFRKTLSVVQFSISIGVIICTLIISAQLKYIMEKDLGLNKDMVLTLSNNPELRDNFDLFKTELQKNPNVLNVTSAAQRPFNVGQSIGINWEGHIDEEQVGMRYTMVDFDFFKTFGMKITQGRPFSNEILSDSSDGCIVNEAALSVMGFDDPIGKTLYFNHHLLPPSRRTVKIIGVVDDFHFSSFHHPMGPFVFRFHRPWHQYVFIKLSPANIQETIAYIKETQNKFAPEYPFEPEFLDEAFNRLYYSETRMGNIFNVFAVLTILISCLGLFGLAASTAEHRRKEIGIRKVLGSTISRIAFMISIDFLKWVAVANIIAWPLAYYFMNKWLQNFTYRISLSVWIFFLSGLAALCIALLTVSYQSIKAATANPVDSLRYE